MICEAVQAYLEALERAESAPPPAPADEALAESLFGSFDESAHVAYEAAPSRLGRLGTWLRRG